MMILPMVSKDVWGRIHGIKCGMFTCGKCGCDIPIDIPAALKGLRGFISKDHGCGPKLNRGVFSPAKKADKILYNNLYDNLSKVSF